MIIRQQPPEIRGGLNSGHWAEKNEHDSALNVEVEIDRKTSG
jgi:hypothetical protein